ncbi:hypothetical protein [Silvanigrella aquatica]|uniref:Uncharacterized protein n=1 Tax=Silvanigrella aquatica TaxID=1915309 RepID=A0A1L4D175_9BACT|nr:hypothetical protein [Silvanigrella aquatica]APJ03951.1 hypothetical protein AXG55_08545 [Silvanigrella aquatica]
MDEFKNEAAGVTSSIVRGLGKKDTAPFVLMGLSIFLIAGLSSLNIFLMFKFNEDDSQKIYIDSMTARWEGMLKQMGEFTKELSISNGSILQLKEQNIDIKQSLSEVKKDVKDHERRLNKIESKVR